MANALQQLAEAGVAVWLDDLSRARIHSGSLAGSVENGEIVGITTNPTIFAKAIGAGSGYEDQVRELALRGTAVGEALRLLTAWDVRAVCDVMRPVFDRTEGRDGRVSIEVDPRIAQDGYRTLAEARGLWWLVDPPNLFIKIPATLAGLSEVAELLEAQGTASFEKSWEELIASVTSQLEKAGASVMPAGVVKASSGNGNAAAPAAAAPRRTVNA